MNTAKMKQRIIFQKYGTVTDSDGFTSQQWKDYYSCWAYANNLSGGEFWEAMVVNAEQTVVFEVRCCDKIKVLNTQDYQILFKSVPYDITFIDSVQYNNKVVKIKAIVKGKANGKL